MPFIKMPDEQRLGLLTRALADVVIAVRQPDVEVKFLYRRPEDLVAGSEALADCLYDQIDWPATKALAQVAHARDDDICIELKNGSCIRFVYENS